MIVAVAEVVVVAVAAVKVTVSDVPVVPASVNENVTSPLASVTP